MKDRTMKKFHSCILEVAKDNYPNIRKRKYSLGYYLSRFINVKSFHSTWCALRHSSDDYYNHYKSIYNEFNKWAKDGVFETAFNNFVKKHFFKLNKARYSKHLKLFIDVTKITNLRGKEHIVINNEYMKKRVTPLSVICDENKLPVAMIVIPINKTLPSGVKTAKHDVSCIQETLDSIKFEIPDYVKISVTGDKGYVTSKKFVIKQRAVTITSPKRRNQKVKTSIKEKKLLKDRYKIENVFAIIKTSPRVFVRSEANLKNYISFVYIAFLERYFRFIETNNPEMLDKL